MSDGAQCETETVQCYRCRTEIDGRGFPVDINTGPAVACGSCFRTGRRLGYFNDY